MFDLVLNEAWKVTARGGRSIIRAVAGLVFAILIGLAAPVSAAGDGHNHGGGSTAVTLAPRAEARLADKQLVLIYSNGRIFAFLEGFVDAEPTRGAELEATVNFLADRLVEVGPGLYRSGPLALSSGRNDVEIAWRIGADEGTATLPVEVKVCPLFTRP